MKPVELFEYFQFGGLVSYLMDASQGFPVHGSGGILLSIKTMVSYLDKFELNLTKRLPKMQNLLKFFKSLAKTSEDYTLKLENAKKLHGIIKPIYESIFAELSTKKVYAITEKRINVNKLIDKISDLMVNNVYDGMPSISQYDFTEAGKCIAYECSTAAAFHILRGLEGTLRMFYEAISNKLATKLRWSQIILELEKTSPPPPKPILEQLDQIKKNYRNPTAHPDKLYDIEEVQDLFNEAIAVINRMMNYLKEKTIS